MKDVDVGDRYIMKCAQVVDDIAFDPEVLMDIPKTHVVRITRTSISLRIDHDRDAIKAEVNSCVVARFRIYLDGKTFSRRPWTTAHSH